MILKIFENFVTFCEHFVIFLDLSSALACCMKSVNQRDDNVARALSVRDSLFHHLVCREI